jgi:hypothetical protein
VDTPPQDEPGEIKDELVELPEFKAPTVPNFTAKEKFERKKREERIHDRDKLERQKKENQMMLKRLLESKEISQETYIRWTRTAEQLMWRRVTRRESSRAKSTSK